MESASTDIHTMVDGKKGKVIILLTNDDGILSPGLRALHDSLSGWADVYVVAPDRERSAASHSLTLDKPLRVEQIDEKWHSVDGTPSDCVYLAINGILKSHKPNLILSGINKGGNLGDDITYSGTVSAAMEGTLFGIPSMAISLVGSENYNFSLAARFSLELSMIISRKGLPKDTLLNVNVPNVDEESLSGVRITRQGKRIYGSALVEKTDPRGRKYYWIGGNDFGWVEADDTDIAAIKKNQISITPLHLDLTNYSAKEKLKLWDELKLSKVACGKTFSK